MFAVLGIALSSVLNRVRGIGKGEFPVYGKLPAAAGIALVAAFFQGWLWGLAWGGAYLFWAAFAWGRWFDLGRLAEGWNREGKEPNFYERIIEKVSKSDHVRFGVRSAFASPFLLILAGPIAAVAFPLAAVGCYEAAWRVSERNQDKEFFKDPIALAEYAVGLVWGVLIVT